jgi:hypothetical protein
LRRGAHLLTHAERARSEHHEIDPERWGVDPAPKREKRERLWRDYNEAVTEAKPLLSRIRKLRAMTSPGLYANALVVRASITDAPHLAKSPAEDLIACPELRATLWAAERVETRS